MSGAPTMSAEKNLPDEPVFAPSERPTVKPPARGSELRLKSHSLDLPIQEILARFDLGDFLGALAVAETILDDGRKPMLLLGPEEIQALVLDDRETFLISLVEGSLSLEVL